MPDPKSTGPEGVLADLIKQKAEQQKDVVDPAKQVGSIDMTGAEKLFDKANNLVAVATGMTLDKSAFARTPEVTGEGGFVKGVTLEPSAPDLGGDDDDDDDDDIDDEDDEDLDDDELDDEIEDVVDAIVSDDDIGGVHEAPADLDERLVACLPTFGHIHAFAIARRAMGDGLLGDEARALASVFKRLRLNGVMATETAWRQMRLADPELALPPWEEADAEDVLALTIFVSVAMAVIPIADAQQKTFANAASALLGVDRLAEMRKSLAGRRARHAERKARRPEAVRRMLAQREANLEAEKSHKAKRAARNRSAVSAQEKAETRAKEKAEAANRKRVDDALKARNDAAAKADAAKKGK